jgi:hypothetical protein
MHEIERVGVASVAKLQAAIAVAMAAIVGLPMLLILLFIEPISGVVVYGLTLAATVVVAGIVGAIGPLVYNFLARILGGVEVELSEQQ